MHGLGVLAEDVGGGAGVVAEVLQLGARDHHHAQLRGGGHLVRYVRDISNTWLARRKLKAYSENCSCLSGFLK